MPSIFADITRVLVQEILDLHEALEFYEMQLFKPETPENLQPAVGLRKSHGGPTQ